MTRTEWPCLHQIAVSAGIYGVTQSIHNEIVGQHHDAGFRIGSPKQFQIFGLPDDYQTGGHYNLDSLLNRAELRLDRKAGIGKQMLQSLFDYLASASI